MGKGWIVRDVCSLGGRPSKEDGHSRLFFPDEKHLSEGSWP